MLEFLIECQDLVQAMLSLFTIRLIRSRRQGDPPRRSAPPLPGGEILLPSHPGDCGTPTIRHDQLDHGLEAV
jgi:hypothetical protein